MQTRLHTLIGEEIQYNNNTCVLIEVIDDGPSLVFQCMAQKTIQHDQHGNANRRSLPTFTIGCLNELQTELHPVLKELLNEADQLTLLSELI